MYVYTVHVLLVSSFTLRVPETACICIMGPVDLRQKNPSIK